MKAVVSIILLVLISATAHAQTWSGYTLELNSLTWGGNGDYTALYRADDQADRTKLRIMMGDEVTSDFEIGYTAWQDGLWNSNFTLDGYGNSYLRGKFGIGNPSPEAFLHIGSSNQGWGKSVRMILEPPQHTGAGWEFAIRDDPNNSFLGMGYGAEQFTFNHNGLLGIGNNAPEAELQIGTSNVGYGRKVRMILEPPQHTGAGWEFAIRDDPNNSFLGIGYGADQFIMDHNGNVGIGTTSPDAKLAVKGTIHANEVKVDLLGAVAPDYVFEKDYPLTSLSELKTYIDQNKHLPEIPSAKEMEENGINLKEMNLLLLKKVEEMTLHMIDLNNQIQELKSKVAANK